MITDSTYNQTNRANWLAVVGNSIEYTTDTNGNITAEIYKNGEAVEYVVKHTYDAQGNILKSVTSKSL